MFLRNGWYVAAWNREVTRERPLGRTLLGEPVVLYRRADGTPVALEDRCCHRHAPLSLGTVVGDDLRCGYHGLKFDGCGVCVEIPGQDRIPPDARIRAVSSDALDRPSAVAELIDDILNHRIDLLVGTQVLAKGHHFPELTLVGVVDADLGLSGWDLRAAERTYQMLHQVAGRAGRAQKPGRVLLQTHDPSHPVLRALASGDSEQFLQQEMAARELLGMPDRKSTRLNSSHSQQSRMPSSA